MTLAQGMCEESDFVELPNGDLFFMHRVQHYDASGDMPRKTADKAL